MYSCQETLYTYGLMTLGFIYLPSVYVIAAFFGPSIAGILGVLWGSIVIAFGVSLWLIFSDLIPRLLSLYFLLFGFFTFMTGILKGNYCQAPVQVKVRSRSGKGQEGQS